MGRRRGKIMNIGTKGKPLTPENIKSYLNSTKDDHRGNGYNDILDFVQCGISVAGIQRLCGMGSYAAVENWVNLIRRKEEL